MHVLNIQIQCNQQHDLEKEKNGKKTKQKNKKTLPKLFYYYFLLCQLKIVLLLEKVHECFINKKFPSEYGLSKLNG